MFTFVIDLRHDRAALEDWLREHAEPIGMKVVLGGYSGFVEFADYHKNKAILFKLTWSHLVTAEQDTFTPTND